MERDFKGVWIPKEIFLIECLTLQEKLLIITIIGLDNGEGCFAGNDYLAKFIQVSKSTCSNFISKLKDKGIIYEPKEFDGRKRYISIDKKLLYSLPLINTEAAFEKQLSSLSNIIKQPLKIAKADSEILEGSHTNIKKQPLKNSDHINIDNNIDINIPTNIINKENAELKNSSHTQQNQNFENDILQLEPLDDEPVKKRKKVAQKKEKEILKIYPHNFSSEMIRAADEFFEYRKEIKKPLKSEKSINTKMNQWSKEINQYGEKVVIESINSSIANGYQGTFIKLDKNDQNGFNNNNTDTFKEFLRKGSNFEL